MPKLNEKKILKAREAVDAYRGEHITLHKKPWHRGIPQEHTPLINTMLSDLKKQGFNSIGEFFAASEELNLCDGELLLLEGECNNCGKCCEGCRNYLGDGVCAIYEKRPQDCKDYPTAVDINTLPKECIYKFVDHTEKHISEWWR